MKKLFCLPIGPNLYDCFTPEKFQEKCDNDPVFEETEAPMAIQFVEVDSGLEREFQEQLLEAQAQVASAMRIMGFSMAAGRPVTAQEIKEVQG